MAPTSRRWIRQGERLHAVKTTQDSSIELTTKRQKVNIKAIKNGKTDSLSILDLPDECILMIFEGLDAESHELCELAKVCKKFHEICFSPRLWRIADFCNVLQSRKRAVRGLNSKPQALIDAERRKHYATFLVKRKAMIFHLRINFSIEKEMTMFQELLEKCNLKDLQFVEIKWSVNWTSIKTPTRQHMQVLSFRKILKYFQQHCSSIISLNCQLDSSDTTARAIGALKNLQYLHVSFLRSAGTRYNSTILSNSFFDILSSLTMLKHLKLEVKQFPPDVYNGYDIRSASLQLLDYSLSEGVAINSLDLPNLESLCTCTACRVPSYYRIQERNCPCLFDFIEAGCPKLRKLNSQYSIIPGFWNFSLSVDDKRKMTICECRVHATRRGFN